MVQKTIGDLTEGSALTGAETVEIEQSGNSRKATLSSTLKTWLDTLYQAKATVLTNTTASFTTALQATYDGYAAGKANASHSHVISDVTSLQTALDGKAASSHSHVAGDVTSGTFANARISAASVTQHEAAITITESQISDFGSYSIIGHNHSGVYEPVDADILRADTDDVLTAGFRITESSDGTKSSGTYTPVPSSRGIRSATFNGAFTLAAPTATDSYTMIIAVTNGASAGAVTLSGFDAVTGDDLTTTNGHKFHLYLTKTSVGESIHIEALQ